MSGKSLTDRTLALAGIFQAASLVSNVAHRGMADLAPLETCIASLFVTDPQQAEDVYGSSSNLRPGLELLRRQLSSDPKRDMELTRYGLALLHLERKLARRKDLLDAITEGLQRAQRQADHFSITHDNVLAGLADVYVNTVSTLTPRIMVSGEHGHLSHTSNANRVRALLLAGIRSAVLWRQCGGSRVQLLLQRKAFLQEAERLLGGTGR